MIYYYGEWWDDKVYMSTTEHDDYNWRSAGEQICNGKNMGEYIQSDNLYYSLISFINSSKLILLIPFFSQT